MILDISKIGPGRQGGKCLIILDHNFLYNYLKKTYPLRSNDLTIIGYTPNLHTAKAVRKIIQKQKKILLDPVMGDVGVGLYINTEGNSGSVM